MQPVGLCAYVKGCKSPLVVKFADTQREKELKRLQTQQIGSMNAAPGLLGMQQTQMVSEFFILVILSYFRLYF